MLDMVKPKEEGKITLSDLKNCKMTPLFFDTFFNLEKYLEHEQKDPFANVRVSMGQLLVLTKEFIIKFAKKKIPCLF